MELNPGGNDGHDAPALWLTLPSYEIQSRQVLAAHIADFLGITGVGSSSIRREL
jgi:hypothetical protein